MFDQLLYTWAGRRSGHDSGFQVIAASGRLTREGGEVHRAAVRLCRYIPPRGFRSSDVASMPVAYGWTDHGDIRLIFRRTYAGRDLLGRPGNFYAHVIAGPRTLGPAAIAACFDSPFWWRGEDLDAYLSGARTLEAVPAGTIPPGPLPDVDEKRLAALCESLLTPGSRLPHVLEVAPPATAALLGAVSRVLPEVLARMPYSTYEPPHTASQFAIVGTAGVDRPANATVVPAHPSTSAPKGVRHTRELALSPIAAERDIVRMSLLAVTTSDGSVDVNRLTGLVAIFDQHNDATPLRTEALLPVLARPESAVILLRQPRAMEAIVNLLVANRAEVWDTLRSIVSTLPDPIVRELGTAVGGAASIATSVSIGEILTQAVTCPPTFTHSCAEAVLVEAEESPSLLSGADPETIVVLVGTAARAGTGSRGVVESLLRLPGAYPSVADDRAVPTAWRAEVMAAELTRNPGSAQSVAASVAAVPHLIRPLAAAVGRHQPLIDVLSTVPPQSTTSLALAAGEELNDGERYGLWAWLMSRLSPDARVKTLLTLSSWIDPIADPRWVRLLAAVTHEWTGSGYLPGRTTVAPAQLYLLVRQCPADSDDWLRFLDQFMTGRLARLLAAGSAEMAQVLAALDQISEPAQRRTAIDLVLVATMQPPALGKLLRPIIRKLARRSPDGYEHVLPRLLTVGPRFAGYSDRRTPAVRCLTCVADLINTGEIRTWPNGSLRHRSTQRLAVELARHLGECDRAAVAASLKHEGGRRAALRWWRVTTAGQG